MKQIILGMLGILITVYTIFIALSIYTIQIHKNQLEHVVSRAVQNALENYYYTSEEELLKEQLEKDILLPNTNGKVMVQITEVDLEKGLLQVKAVESLRLITGQEKELVCTKTAIMEKEMVDYPQAEITFLVDGNIYKQFQIQHGEICPMPKKPYENFAGWIDANTGEYVEEIGAVWEDKVYVGIGSL